MKLINYHLTETLTNTWEIRDVCLVLKALRVTSKRYKFLFNIFLGVESLQGNNFMIDYFNVRIRILLNLLLQMN